MSNLSGPGKILAAVATFRIAVAAWVPGRSRVLARPFKSMRLYELPRGVAVVGYFDHLLVDLKGKRLFLRPERYHEALVLRTVTGKVVHEIKCVEKPHGNLFLADRNTTTSPKGGDGSLNVVSASVYKMKRDFPPQGCGPSSV